MGIFSPPSMTPPPPPPIPPAANPQTMASANVQGVGEAAKARARMAAGGGNSGTDLTKPDATGAAASTPTAKATLGGA